MKQLGKMERSGIGWFLEAYLPSSIVECMLPNDKAYHCESIEALLKGKADSVYLLENLKIVQKRMEKSGRWDPCTYYLTLRDATAEVEMAAPEISRGIFRNLTKYNKKTWGTIYMTREGDIIDVVCRKESCLFGAYIIEDIENRRLEHAVMNDIRE